MLKVHVGIGTLRRSAVCAPLIAGTLGLGCGGGVRAGPLESDASNSNDAGGDAVAEADFDATSAMDGSTTDASPLTDAAEDESAGDAAQDGKSIADGSSDGSELACSITGMARAARSSGFSGTDSDYYNLFDSVPCAKASDCVPSCVSAGGSTASCTAGEQCVTDDCADGGFACLMCLPPTYWLDPSGALGPPNAGTTGHPAEDIQAFDNGYNDSLLVTSFGIALPSGATVRGIEFTVERSANDGNATDESLRVIKAGTPVGTNHASNMPWPATFTEATYGLPTDTWGVTWTTADVESNDFGISITPQFLSAAGNDTVEIDSVSATILYGGTGGCP